MRNYAIKFEIVLRRFHEDASSRDFLELSLADAFSAFKEKLPASVRECLFFAFSEQAFLDVLDQEFDLVMERPALVFRKAMLDDESLRLAAGLPSEVREEERFIEDLATWLLNITRPLFKADLSEEKVRKIELEYQESLRVYAQKYNDLEEYNLKTLFVRRHLITRYTHAMTSDALFKADAVKALLGEDNGYYQAWYRKELFRHRVTQAVEKHLFSRVA